MVWFPAPKETLLARVAAAVDAALAEALPAGGNARSALLERDWQRRAIGHLLALDRLPTLPPGRTAGLETLLDGEV